LKTPITAISGYAELLETGMADESHKEHFYQEIRKNSDRLLTLINDIIRLSELDRSEKEPSFEEIDLYKIAMESMETLTVSATQRNVELSLEGSQAMMVGNRDMVKELIENLVQNAIRYNNDGGKVSVIVKKENRAVLVVRDNGIGIPAAEQQRVFERFYRVDKSRSKATGGTGLGLAIVKHIVEIHEAEIELDSAPGVGTTISVYF
ncbi:MAG: two-component sensor histidine kinase, partial [Lachnospiraceae bacterium]|nr:two-component sensor histidine kinase [Lachnospiraceae bacterium]